MKEVGHGVEEGPTICFLIQHFLDEIDSAIYMIRPPLDFSEHDEDQMIEYNESDSDSKHNIAMLAFKERNSFLHSSAFVNLGSKIYLFGGTRMFPEENTPALELDTLSRRVQVININDPEPKIQSVAPMNTPKNSPCVFVADSMIYALAAHPLDCTIKPPGYKYTGLFECYDPITDRWEVLPDPPLFHSWAGAELSDCATVIGRRVIIGCPYFHAIFNLDSRTWEPTFLPAQKDLYFPFGSLFVQQSQSLYHLSGLGVPLNPSLFTVSPFFALDTAVTRFPLPAATLEVSGKCQIMTRATDLDDNKSFTKRGYFPERYFFHVGGAFFCYVVTAQLFDQCNNTQYEPYSRAVLIKFFEEVPAHTDNSKWGSNSNNSETVFRPVASFCYKINTTFPNFSLRARCCVIGTVPRSWINSPPMKEQEASSSMSVNRGMNSYYT